MVLIIGGAYQGKLDIAKERYNLTHKDSFDCINSIDFSYKILNNMDQFIFSLIEKGENPVSFIEKNLAKFNNSIVILTDICCGVVPINQDERQWREDVGKIGVKFSTAADEVIRVFCGIPSRLK